ncbi:MAG: UspA domain protein [Myxococcales bacterium]|nr:UspA domain protein [Myxococcales bacterium]
MSSTSSQVVVGFNLSRSGREALHRAIALATRAPGHVLHFVCVIEPHSAIPSIPTNHVDYQYAERVQQALTDVVTAELQAGNITDRIHFCVHARIGKPADEILGLARDVGADLFIDAVIRHSVERAEVAVLNKPFCGHVLAGRIRQILDLRR